MNNSEKLKLMFGHPGLFLHILRKNAVFFVYYLIDLIGLYQLEYLAYKYLYIRKTVKGLVKPVNKGLLSVVVVTYNSQYCLDDSLWIFENTDIGMDVEIIIVDNNSKDISYLKKYSDKKYKVIFNKDNLLFTTAVNQGMSLADGGYILLLNPDVSYEKGLDPHPIREAIRLLEEDDRNGIAGIIQLLPGTDIISCYGTEFYNRFTKKKMRYGRVYMHRYPILHMVRVLEGGRITNQLRQNIIVHSTRGSFFLVKREVINDIGLLPCTKYTMHLYSETLYCQIAAANKWNTVQVGKSYIYHEIGKSVNTIP